MNEFKHERDCSKEASHNFQKDIDKAVARKYYSSTKPGQHEIHQRANLFTTQVYEKIRDKWIDGKIGATRTGARRLKEVAEECGGFQQVGEDENGNKIFLDLPGDGVYSVSLIALKCIIDRFSSNKELEIPIAAFANSIGEWIEAEWDTNNYLNNQEGDVVKGYGRQILKRSSSPKRRRTDARQGMRKLARRCNFPAVKERRFVGTEQFMVGNFLLEVAVTLNIVTINQRYNGNKRGNFISFNPDFVDAVVELEKNYNTSSYLHKPMVEPPQKWEVTDEPSNLNKTGGYHWEHAKKKRTMCRHFFSESNFKQEAVDTINNMGEVKFKVYSQVLDVANNLKHQVGHFQPMPEPPTKVNLPEGVTPEEIQDAKTNQRLLWELHQKLIKKFMRTRAVLKVANEYNDGREFNYGWNFDYRGRMYPLNTFLQIQGTDLDRALICFSEGSELTKSGKKWASRAIAASYLGTSDSYTYRQVWTKENESLIRRVAGNPEGTISEWSVAKDPWQFLQLCFEYTAVVLDETKTLWQVPIAIDSTASGLQLLSAMRLDKQGMTYANLLKPDKGAKPLDAYEAVLALARGNVSKPSITAYLQDRKVGKPALMLSIYGGSQLTIRKRIKEFYDSKDIDITKEDLSEVTSLVIKASKSLFPAAFEALKWLKKLGTIVAERDGRIQWKTPTENLIDLTENEFNIIQVRTELMGKINVCIGETTEPNYKAMVNAFAPGFVHSWDASLVQRAFSNWSKPLASTHDSISVLPSDMEHAIDKIKGSFQSICSGDVLTKLAEDMGVSEDELPRLAWDEDNKHLLSEVSNSEYFFN